MSFRFSLLPVDILHTTAYTFLFLTTNDREGLVSDLDGHFQPSPLKSYPLGLPYRFTYAEKMWNTIKKSNLLSKYEELLQTLPE